MVYPIITRNAHSLQIEYPCEEFPIHIVTKHFCFDGSFNDFATYSYPRTVIVRVGGELQQLQVTTYNNQPDLAEEWDCTEFAENVLYASDEDDTEILFYVRGTHELPLPHVK